MVNTDKGLHALGALSLCYNLLYKQADMVMDAILPSSTYPYG